MVGERRGRITIGQHRYRMHTYVLPIRTKGTATTLAVPQLSLASKLVTVADGREKINRDQAVQEDRSVHGSSLH